MTDRGEYDYVIVGGGTAGCILAARLSEDPAVTVLLLEAGGSDRSWKVRMPCAYDYLFKNEKFNWCYTRRARAGAGRSPAISAARQGAGRIVQHQRARLHPRPSPRLRALGDARAHAGWSYREVLPYFRALGKLGRGRQRLSRRRRPVGVLTPDCKEPLYAVFLEAGRAGGPSALRGSERRRAGRFRRVPGQHRSRRACLHRARLSSRRGGQRRISRCDSARRSSRMLLQGNRADGVSYAQAGAERQVRGGPRGDPGGRHIQLAAAADASGHRAGRRAAPRTASRWRSTFPASARTCRTIPASYMKYECTEPLSITRYLRRTGWRSRRCNGSCSIAGRRPATIWRPWRCSQRSLRAAAGHRDPAPGRDLRSC